MPNPLDSQSVPITAESDSDLHNPVSLAQLHQNFAAIQPVYQAAISDPSAIKPLLIPADSYFTSPNHNPALSRCPVCAATFAAPDHLAAHINALHPSFFPHNSPLSPIDSLPQRVLAPWLRAAVQPAQPPNSLLPVPNDASQYRCDTCNIFCDTIDQIESHRSGQKHRKRAELTDTFRAAAEQFEFERIRERENGVWFCDFCGTSMCAPNEVLQHISCSKHKRWRLALSSSSSQPPWQSTQPTSITSLKSSPLSQPMSTIPSLATPLSASTSIPIPYPLRTTNPQLNGMQHSSPFMPLQREMSEAVNKLSPQQFTCSVCAVYCTSNDNLNTHLSSERHRKRMECNPSANIDCAVCQITVCGAINFQAHLVSKGHKKKLENPNSSAIHDLKCLVCNISVTGAVNFVSHLKGKQHAKKEKQVQRQGEIPPQLPPALPTHSQSAQIPNDSSSGAPLILQHAAQQNSHVADQPNVNTSNPFRSVPHPSHTPKTS